jgi:E3 ubiquitin-protein ligase synoviolin
VLRTCTLLTNISDLLKLLAYIAFFTILTVFYGIPIYIIRDLYMTMRSFSKRITDYVRYQAATRDMHARYPDATAEEMASDNTCIVCREEMKPWAGGNAQAQGAAAQPGTTTNERQRPKKLPCGHILHFSCLQSWLERQQSCPTCRGSVFAAPTVRGGQTPPPPANGQAVAPDPAAAVGGAANPGANNANPNPAVAAARRDEGRVYRLGPLRLQIGGQLGGGRRNDQQELLDILARMARDRAGRPRNVQNAAPAQPQVPGVGVQAQPTATGTATPSNNMHPALRSATTALQLNVIEAQIRQEIAALNLASERLTAVQALQAELDRLQNLRQNQQAGAQTSSLPINPNQILSLARGSTPGLSTTTAIGVQAPQQQQPANLPAGMVLPEGWNLVPLRPAQQLQPTRTVPAEAHAAPVIAGPSSRVPSIASTASSMPSIDEVNGTAMYSNGVASGPSNASPLVAPSVSAPPTVPTSSWSFPPTGGEPASDDTSSKATSASQSRNLPTESSSTAAGSSSKENQPSVEDTNEE